MEKRLILTCNEESVLAREVPPMTVSNHGQALSKSDIAKRLAFINLCREFQSRTGHPLCKTDKAVLARYKAELKQDGAI